MDPVVIEERNRRAKPPKEAYFFFPKENDVIIRNYSDEKKSIRKVFDINEDQYTHFEKEQIKNFNSIFLNYSKSYNISLPESWKVSDTLRFLQATGHDITKSCELVKQHILWKRTYFPYTINNKTIELLNSGFIYGHGRDCRFRPIFIIKADTYMRLSKVYKYEEWLLAIIYFIEYIIENMIIPGQIENWIIIADMNNVSVFSIPNELMNIFSILQANYRCRLNTIYILNMSIMLNFLWNIIKNWIQPSTFKKIRFVKKFSEIYEYINPEQVELKYGGLAENKESNYFPPFMPSENYLLPGENKEDVLFNEEEYKDLLSYNRVTTISPYLKIDSKSVNSRYTVANTFKQQFTSAKNYTESIYEDARSFSEKEISFYENCLEDILCNNNSKIDQDMIIENENHDIKYANNTPNEIFVYKNNIIENKKNEIKYKSNNITDSADMRISIDSNYRNPEKQIVYEKGVNQACCRRDSNCVIF